MVDGSLEVVNRATRLSEALGRYVNGLTVVGPCMGTLVRRVAHIDAEVAAVALDVQGPLQQLNSTLSDVEVFQDSENAPPDDTIRSLQVGQRSC